jgi:hypothetical protein
MGKTPESRPAGRVGGVRFDQVRRDVPIVDEDGCRIVGPAQAAMDYAKPIWDQVKPGSQCDAQKALNLGMALWNLALEEQRGERHPDLRAQIVEGVAEAGIPSPEEFVGMMIERHRAMFPDAGRGTGGFYERERVIDPLPDWVPFNEGGLPAGPGALAGTEADTKALSAFREYDMLIAEGKADSLENAFPRLIKATGEAFDRWLERSGIAEQDAGRCWEIVDNFLSFLSRYRGEPLFGNPDRAVSEFLMTWLFRKARLDACTHSAAPAALVLLGRYLDALGHSRGLEGRMRNACEPLRTPFRETLERYYGPPSKAK